MKITKTSITVKDLADGYVNYTDEDIEKGVYAYHGKLCVRPPFQRSFVYNKEQENAVIDTALKGFPLNIMYWVDNGDGTYDCLDGQQRTISLCNFVTEVSSFKAKWFNNEQYSNLTAIRHINPELAENFLNYELEVYICQGTKFEQLEWFKTVNIAGEELYPQELRNASYASPWLTDAKRYFSRANASSSAKSPAEELGGNYTNKNANRQEILEQVISWRIGSKEEEDICQYMSDHCNDDDASDLWDYFNDVIDWVKELFPFSDQVDKGFKTVMWGKFYNEYNEEEFDPDEMINTFNELNKARANKELDVSVAKICEYCITRNESLLKQRAFNEYQKNAMYVEQKGICLDCGKHFLKNKMQAHHIIPWYNGGRTELNNGVMLCEDCHRQRHL